MPIITAYIREILYHHCTLYFIYHIHFLRSQFLPIKDKVQLYQTLIRPVLASGSEMWVLSKSDEDSFGVFERKILTAMFEPTNDNGEWRIKYNNDLYTLYKENDIVKYIKINHLKFDWRSRALHEDFLLQ